MFTNNNIIIAASTDSSHSSHQIRYSRSIFSMTNNKIMGRYIMCRRHRRQCSRTCNRFTAATLALAKAVEEEAPPSRPVIIWAIWVMWVARVPAPTKRGLYTLCNSSKRTTTEDTAMEPAIAAGVERAKSNNKTKHYKEASHHKQWSIIISSRRAVVVFHSRKRRRCIRSTMIVCSNN